MSITRPASALESIDKITDRLAADNNGEIKLSSKEKGDLQAKFWRLNEDVERHISPNARRPKNERSLWNMAFSTLIALAVTAAVLTVMVVVLGLILQSVLSSVATSMHPMP